MAGKQWRSEARALIDSIAPERVDALLKGAVDLHVHSGPSTMPRQLDHLEEVDQAAAAGMRGVLFKDHHYSVSPMMPMLERISASSGVHMFGSLVLNNTVGGLNPHAVDYNVKMGAKLVFMPTAHAANHIRNTHRNARLASNVQLRKPYGITVIDATGELLDPVKQILDIIAEHDVILSSGHLHIAEVWVLFEEAKRRGVKRLLVNHPAYGLHCTYEDVSELAAMGAMIEQSACLFVDSRFNVFPPDELKAQVDAAGVANSSIGSDLGQVDNPSPVEGMRQIIAMLLALGFSDEDVGKMVRDNPARLVGLES
ncbi:MAG: hypothetical protein CMJ15_05365 [Pelagibacterium sp.]|nr:hypothetical protein [Pelagibacterium sp.]